MNRLLLPVISAVIAASATAALAQTTSTPARPETPVLGKDEYRQKLDEVIVIGQDPYWRQGGQPRWDRGKVDVDLNKPASEPRLQMFPNYTAEERDEAMKIPDRNNATPKIKVFERKF